MWSVFVCIVCILLYDVARYMSHTIELVCVCMCLYCLYVYVFFSMYFAPNVQVRFLGREKLLSVLATKSKKIVLRWLAIACMCLYCMYMTVLCVSSVSACIVWINGVFACIAAAHTIITVMSPNDSLLWQHRAGLTQGTPGHGRQYFFTPSLRPPTTQFRAPPPPPLLEVPELPPPRGWEGSQAESALVDPDPSPITAYWESYITSWDIERLPQPPKDPSRPWLAYACMCLYTLVLHVYAFICMYMYVYVCIVCMCMYLTQWYIYPQTWHSVRATVGSVGHTITYHYVDVCSSPRNVKVVLLPFPSLFESTLQGTRSWPVQLFPFCVLCKTENQIHTYTYGYMHIQANTHT